MTEITLQYQGSGRGMLTSTRKKAALQLCAWAVVLLVFAAIVGAYVFTHVVVVRRMGPWLLLPGGRGWYRTPSTIYEWKKLIWVGAVMIGPMLLAGAYWFLGRAIGRRRDRTLTIAALSLTMLHTLAAGLGLLTFLLMGYGSLLYGNIGGTSLTFAVGSILAVAMVPGMLYLSVQLMDLLKERVIVRKNSEAPPPADVSSPAKNFPPATTL